MRGTIKPKAEEWKDIKGLDSYYRVSDKGNIYSKINNMLLKQTASKSGYLSVKLRIEQGKAWLFSVHRLVAENFINDIPKGMVVNHKDGNKANNSVSNLEIVTSSENNKHAYRILGKVPKGFCIPENKKPVINPVSQFDLEGNFIKTYQNPHIASLETGINSSSIGRVCKGLRNKAGGFKWVHAPQDTF